jgi:uncharacterized protein
MGLSFKKLEISDGATIRAYSGQYAPYSDFNFTNLWAWYNAGESTQYCFLNENLVIEYVGLKEEYHFYSFLGNNRVVDTIDTLLNASVQRGMRPVMDLVPEISLFSPDQDLGDLFDIGEDRDMFDYVYRLQDVVELDGSQNSAKRRAYRKFLRDYGDYEVAALDLRLPTARDHIMSLLDVWYQQKGGTQLDAGHERLALNRVLEAADYLDTTAVGLYLEGELIGFFFSEILDDEQVMGHFKKGDYRYTGIFQVLEIENARYLLESGCTYLNEQQDLGLKGLRRSKLDRNPAHFLKKYTVAARE